MDVIKFQIQARLYVVFVTSLCHIKTIPHTTTPYEKDKFGNVSMTTMNKNKDTIENLKCIIPTVRKVNMCFIIHFKYICHFWQVWLANGKTLTPLVHLVCVLVSRGQRMSTERVDVHELISVHFTLK